MEHGHVLVVLVPGVEGGAAGAELAAVQETVRKVDVLHVILAVRLLAKLLAANCTAIVGPSATIHPLYVSLQH